MAPGTSSSAAPLVDVSKPELQETFDHCFGGTLISMDPDILAMDPAERLEFSRLRNQAGTAISRFDSRSDTTLREAMFDEKSGLERERAAWEYGDRLRINAVPDIVSMLSHEQDSLVRRGLLWLLQKHGGLRAISLFKDALSDQDVEVRDWARMLLMESDTTAESRIPVFERPLCRNEKNPFDQTLPLMIAGHARSLIPGMGWAQVTLSPQWFEQILGRVMACTNEDTFEKTLVIEKRLKEYHDDGSDHYEIYKFNGLSHALDEHTMHHQYESSSSHTFYPSGKVEDLSLPPVGDMTVNLARVALTLRVPDPAEPRRKVVHSVRGRYMGWAYVDLPRIFRSGMRIGPGEVQLSSLHHPQFGHLTNTYLYGSFKGKISDHDGDGYLDVNTELCHGTTDGQLDYQCAGSPNPDPFDPFGKVK